MKLTTGNKYIVKDSSLCDHVKIVSQSFSMMGGTTYGGRICGGSLDGGYFWWSEDYKCYSKEGEEGWEIVAEYDLTNPIEKCVCDIHTLMREGCICGYYQKEKSIDK